MAHRDDGVDAVVAGSPAETAGFEAGDVIKTVQFSDGTVIVADAPESEVSRYAIDIRSVSHGSGAFSRKPAGFAPMPASVARRLLEAQ